MNSNAIGVILEAARESGFGRFDHFTIRVIHGTPSRFTATMHSGDISAVTGPHGTGASPAEAIENAADRVRKWSEDRQASAANDAKKHGNLVASLSACKAVGGEQ